MNQIHIVLAVPIGNINKSCAVALNSHDNDDDGVLNNDDENNDDSNAKQDAMSDCTLITSITLKG